MKNLNKFPSHRQRRVGEQLRQLISSLLIKEEFHSSFLNYKLISVVDVDLSPDLKNAKVFVDINFDKDNEKILNDLNKKTGFIKKKLSKSLKLKFFPNLKFYIDTSVEYSKKINSILKDLSQE